MLCVSISYAVNSWTSRSVSYNDKNSEMHTQTNVVFSYYFVRNELWNIGTEKRWRRAGSLNWVLTSVMTDRIDSSFANMSSCASCWPPIIVDIYLKGIVGNQFIFEKVSDRYWPVWSWARIAHWVDSAFPELSQVHSEMRGSGGCVPLGRYRRLSQKTPSIWRVCGVWMCELTELA